MEQKNNLAVVLGIGLVIVALLLAFNSKSNVVVGQNGVQRNTVSVSGTSTLSIAPDKAEIYVRVVTVEKTAQDSKNKNSLISSNMVKALKKEGIKDSDIETSQYSIYPKYDYQENTDARKPAQQVLTGYEVANVLKVTTKELEKAGKLIDVSVENGANEIERVSFALTKEKEKDVKQQAMILASNDAKDKAVALVTNLEVGLGKPVSITESNFYYQPYNFYAGAAPLEKSSADTTINPQKLDVSATVALVYEIR